MKRRVTASEWADALESGAYEQGGDYMAVENYDEDMEPTGDKSYCCLGVLCAEYLPYDEWFDKDWFAESGTESADLPHDVLERSPFMNKNGSYLNQGVEKNHVLEGTVADMFAYMNDRGVGFKAIARVIREWEQMEFDEAWLSGRVQGEIDRVRKEGRDY